MDQGYPRALWIARIGAFSPWRWKYEILCLIFTLMMTIPVTSSSVGVTVHLVDARSGKPLKGIAVEMFTWQGESRSSSKGDERAKIQATTNEDGLAAFQLGEPLPRKVGFLLVPPDDFSGCWGQEFSPEEVLRSGVIANFLPKCGKLKWKVSAKPGEIVIFEKKLTPWEKMRRETP